MRLLIGGLVVFASAWTTFAHAELASMSDDELSSVQGAGVGLVLENFVFDHGDDASNGRVFRIGGIKSSDGDDVQITVSQLYIARSGSNYGENLQPVNLGRLVNPYKIDLVNGNGIGIANKSVIDISAPTQLDQTSTVSKDLDMDGQLDPVHAADGTPVVDENGNPVLRQYAANPDGFDCLTGTAGSGLCSSRMPISGFDNGERPDIGLKLQVQVGGNEPDSLNIHAKSAVFDGSHLRLWGDNNRLAAEFRLNFYTPELSITACEDGGADCGKEIKMHNFALELALGNPQQPMFLDVNGQGNFVFEIKSIRDAAAEKFGVSTSSIPTQLGWSGGGTRDSAPNKAMWDYFNDYYSNPEYRGNLYIGKLEVVDPGGSMDFGSSRIEGMLIQYMNITSHDLAP